MESKSLDVQSKSLDVQCKPLDVQCKSLDDENEALDDENATADDERKPPGEESTAPDDEARALEVERRQASVHAARFVADRSGVESAASMLIGVQSSVDRRARFNLAHFGEAVGEPSRAAMLIALMGGVARPASDLARIAGVAASTATSHLQRLEYAGLVTVRPQGRHRYYALAGPHVAHAVETLATCATERSRVPTPRPSTDPMVLARTCYGHLAGRLAIALWSRAKAERWVRWSDVAISLLPKGREALTRCGLFAETPAALVGRPCLDWSERVPHVSGSLGIALCDAMVAHRWVARRPGEGRALRVTALGEARLRELGVRWS